MHTIFACYVFVRTYQREGIVQSLLNIAFIIIIFTVGWTISDLLVGFIVSADGYSISLPQSKTLLSLIKATGFFKPGSNGYGWISPKDSVSLLFLSTIEVFFYRFYFKNTKVN